MRTVFVGQGTGEEKEGTPPIPSEESGLNQFRAADEFTFANVQTPISATLAGFPAPSTP